nr:CRTAC1 family protein [uncultured Rhodopila sp.]
MIKTHTAAFSLGLLAATALLASCKEKKQAAIPKKADYAVTAPKQETAVNVPVPVFKDITQEAGITFAGVTGADGRKLMPETMGSGVGLIDYDGDGWLDLVLVNGRPWDATKKCPPLLTVYHNERNGKFRDVTSELGLENLCGYGMGVAIADYDGDGRPDIFVTSLDGNHLLHNDGKSFTDVTERAGLNPPKDLAQRWSTSAAWLDATGDGRPDLFIANYVRWTPETDVFTTRDGTTKSYATPTVYKGVSNRLFRNRGDGTFEDVTVQSGIYDDHNKALGVVVLDISGDRHPDLFVSNDTQPNKLYVNDGHGHFVDRALEYGVGYDEMGRAKAGMGTDAADIGGGVLAIGVGNFSDEAVSHFELPPAGANAFTDGSPRRGLASATLADLTFGTRFADLNNDGRPDLILINGHIEPDIARVQAGTTYAQLPRLFLQDASGRYQEYSRLAGKPLMQPVVGRSLAIGDVFNDGNLDLLISTNGGPAHLLRNVSPPRGFVELTLVGKGGNRDALGASVVVEADTGWRWTDTVRSRGSYLASSPYTLHTGVPDGVAKVALHVVWPDGSKSDEQEVAVGHCYRLTQDGVLTSVEFPKVGG